VSVSSRVIVIVGGARRRGLRRIERFVKQLGQYVARGGDGGQLEQPRLDQGAVDEPGDVRFGNFAQLAKYWLTPVLSDNPCAGTSRPLSTSAASTAARRRATRAVDNPHRLVRITPTISTITPTMPIGVIGCFGEPSHP
jgi:hypothetical protein